MWDADALLDNHQHRWATDADTVSIRIASVASTASDLAAHEIACTDGWATPTTSVPGSSQTWPARRAQLHPAQLHPAEAAPRASEAEPPEALSLPQVKVMLDWDPTGKNGPSMPIPDVVKIHTPKDDDELYGKPFVGKEQD